MEMFANFEKAQQNTGNKVVLNLAAGRRAILAVTTLQLQMATARSEND